MNSYVFHVLAVFNPVCIECNNADKVSQPFLHDIYHQIIKILIHAPKQDFQYNLIKIIYVDVNQYVCNLLYSETIKFSNSPIDFKINFYCIFLKQINMCCFGT